MKSKEIKTTVNGITYQAIFEPDKESMIKALMIVLECIPEEEEQKEEQTQISSIAK